ncbi:MAG: histidinol dehydrogenase [Bacilli bacterium]|nr:histidinol dehydrogenase [Bacilli bacterium]
MIEIIKEKAEINKFLEILELRCQVDQDKYFEVVQKIVKDVRNRKDEALLEYTKKFDFKDADLTDIEIPQNILEAAFNNLDKEMQEVLTLARDRIIDFHVHQKQTTWLTEFENGESMGQKITPLKRVGVYVPGGKASYPSSVLMNVIPAKVAGVEEIIMVTPSQQGIVAEIVLAAAYVAGVTKVFKIGGAQAIAALAYGTAIIPKVDKIVGPGNIYVALAKRLVYGEVDIDSFAGPSEILIIADDEANSEFVAADLLGQAEHDVLASSILLTDSPKLAQNVLKSLNAIYITASRKDILKESLSKYSKIIIVESIKEAIDIANSIAPEHLEMAVAEPTKYLDEIKNAGAIFLGNYTPEAIGDYLAGPNHVLPTAKTARFSSVLNVEDFVKKSSILYFTKESLNKISDKAIKFAKIEGFDMHAKSLEVRKK